MQRIQAASAKKIAANSFAYGYVLLALTFIFLPVVMLMVFSFNSAEVPRLPLKSFTWHWYRELFANEVIIEALVRSVLLGVFVGLTTVVLGFLAAYSLARYTVRFQTLFQTLLTLPMTVSFTIMALGLLIFFREAGISKSIFAVWLAHSAIFLPIPVAIIYSQLGRFQVNFERASMDLGANIFKTMLYITLPMILPSLLASFFLVFTLSWDEFIVAFFLLGFEITLPVKIWAMLRAGTDPAVNALGTIVFGISMVTAFIAFLLFRRSQATRGAIR